MARIASLIDTKAEEFRANASQMRALDWDGPLDPDELLLDTKLFAPPEQDLIE